MMSGMSWFMGAISVLILVVLVLAIIALLKYLFRG